jgi:hypothetical protein
VSHDGGGPLVRQRGEGQTAATQMFQARAAALRAACARSPTPRSLVAAATLDPADPAAARATRGVIPRLPGPRTRVSPVITQARQRDRWPHRDETTRDDGMA